MLKSEASEAEGDLYMPAQAIQELNFTESTSISRRYHLDETRGLSAIVAHTESKDSKGEVISGTYRVSFWQGGQSHAESLIMVETHQHPPTLDYIVSEIHAWVEKRPQYADLVKAILDTFTHQHLVQFENKA